jgi:hypothetical protein
MERRNISHRVAEETWRTGGIFPPGKPKRLSGEEDISSRVAEKTWWRGGNFL